MSPTPVVAVLLPVYNGERFLGEAIASVLGQTFEDFELLVLDDGLEEVRSVLELVAADPGITAVSFKQLSFWVGFNYLVDSWYLWQGAEMYHWLFRWGSTLTYATHRPPTVLNESGRNLRTLTWLDRRSLARRGILLYHYSLVFPRQVAEKSAYYDQAVWVEHDTFSQWPHDNFVKLRNPYRVHNVYDLPSWLERFESEHPPAIETLRRDLSEGKVREAMRTSEDVEAYRLGRAVVKACGRLTRAQSSLRRTLLPLVRPVRGRLLC